jgi:Flp pilus assembly protein TadG
MRGTALMEFALAWPVALVLVLGAVETAVWGSELFAARSAALAGARAGAVAGAKPAIAAEVALRTLAPSLVGVVAAAWCQGDSRPEPRVWVCARDLGDAVEVQVGGEVPALVPLVRARGLPLQARATVAKEVFTK